MKTLTHKYTIPCYDTDASWRLKPTSFMNMAQEAALGGWTAYSKIDRFLFLPSQSLSMAATTFVGQNLGAGRLDRVRTGVRQGLIMLVAASELVGIVTFIFAPQFIGLFSPSAAVVAYGVRHARTVTLFYCLLGFAHGAASVLRGAGHAVSPMVVFMSVWCLFRISYVTVMVQLFHDITAVLTAYPVTWAISSILFALLLKFSHWMTPSRWGKKPQL